MAETFLKVKRTGDHKVRVTFTLNMFKKWIRFRVKVQSLIMSTKWLVTQVRDNQYRMERRGIETAFVWVRVTFTLNTFKKWIRFRVKVQSLIMSTKWLVTQVRDNQYRMERRGIGTASEFNINVCNVLCSTYRCRGTIH